ncbi:MAG: ADP/ATP-dependent (S)-NAD(P)H-hydrate dehydratase [bacterium]|nr:ADP/ATP-dependent (S)-NAD(P)H-hydrate dehydratase [bacterium]
MKLNLPQSDGHKGQNGKVLIVGGSKLFHAASLWSAQTAAHLVDMVFYASVKNNNKSVQENKKKFFDGIVIERDQILTYAQEADVILIGPGLERGQRQPEKLVEILQTKKDLTFSEWENNTYLITNFLLAKFPQKKFVLDAGALQMLDLNFLPANCILTPHQKEALQLEEMADTADKKTKLQAVTILRKNIVDQVWKNNKLIEEIKGGNAGLTKGGSGDALAGLIAGLFAYNNDITAAVWGSRVLKKTADELYHTVGPFFTITELVAKIPAVLWTQVQAQ